MMLFQDAAQNALDGDALSEEKTLSVIDLILMGVQVVFSLSPYYL